MRRAGIALSLGSAVVVIGGALGSGCVFERRLFDVEIVAHEAESVDGALDVLDGVTYSLIPDRGEENGTEATTTVIEFAPDPAATTLAVALDLFNADFTRFGGGRSGPVPLPDEGGVLEVPVLVAPASVDVLTSLPPAPGPDACVVDDGRGRVFIVGGSDATQQAYVFDDAFDLRSIGGGGFPAGVETPGCGATAGVVAVAGGCSANAATTFIEVIALDGTRTRLDTDRIGEPCGAAAAARHDGAVWLVDGDHSVHVVDDGGSRDVAAARAGTREGLEVTASDAVVFIVDGTLLYGSDDGGVVSLGPAVALGRRGDEVLVLDPDGSVGAVENATVRAIPRVVVDVADVRHFVLLDDGTFVSLRRDGRTLDVRDADGGRRSLPTGVAGLTRVAALPGGTIVLGGADDAGLRAVSIR
jgi:hypothetical protein